MKINFYPDRDDINLKNAAVDYAKIWSKDGSKIISTIENVSGLRFREKFINAIIYDDISYSYPLSLDANISLKYKKLTLIHELCHRLLIGNKIKWEKLNRENTYYLISHRPLNLFLYDALTDLYGENIAKENVDHEISLWNKKGISPYKIAWDWALGMTREERQIVFKKYLV